MGYSIVRYRVKKGRHRGLEGDGCKFSNGLIVLCHPSISNPVFTEHFKRSELIPLDYVLGRRHHPNRHAYDEGKLVNVPYFTRGDLSCRIEGEKANYIEIKENVVTLHSQSQKGLAPSGRMSPRGKIRSFSRKSRARMIQLMASLEKVPNLWVDHTYADDVMIGLNESERAFFSSRCMDRFERWFTKEYPKAYMVWRREWQDRKSGSLKGDICPHFHCLYHIPGLETSNHVAIAVRIALAWVTITGSKDPHAVEVAMHPESYRKIDSLKMAQVYVSKYVAKEETHPLDDDVSLGRYWGKVGLLPMGKVEYETLTTSEETQIRRFLRRFVKDRRYKRLVKSESGFWLLIRRKTISRMLEYIRAANMDMALEFGFT